MTDRVLIGRHPNITDNPYGLYVSPTNVDVKVAANDDYFLLDSEAVSHGQLLCWQEVVTDSGNNGSGNGVSFTYNSHGVRNFAFAFSSQISGTGSETASDISCLSEAVGTARASASYNLFGGALGGLGSSNYNNDLGNDITYTIKLTNSGTTGTCLVERFTPYGSTAAYLVNVLIFSEVA